MTPIIELRDIDKRFGAVHALKKVSLAVNGGETIALVGENGAGKSTLVKVLTGAYTKDSGEIWIEGKEALISDTISAKKFGIAQVYQQAELWPELLVAENIYLGDRSMSQNGLVNWKNIHRNAAKLLEKYGIPIKDTTRVKDLSVASRQLVAIAKALSRNPKVVIFDEPTAVLSDKEVNILFNIIWMLKKEKTTIIYISHRLEEVFELSDRIAVMRDGSMVTVLENHNVTKNDLIAHMLGRHINAMYPEKNVIESDEVVLELRNVSTDKVRNISFTLRKGEILGIVGLVNSGRTETARAIYGIDRIKQGEMLVFGKPVNFKSPTDAVRHGLFLAPEDRKEEALVQIRKIRENITLSNLKSISRFGFCNRQKENSLVSSIMRDLRIKAGSMESEINTLSGGNQQKVVIAKAFVAKPKILIFDEPTQGIDVGAKSEVNALLQQLGEEGMSIILISSEIEEVQGMCNRIVVMRNGTVAGEVEDNLDDGKHILDLMYRSENDAKLQ